MGPIHHPFPALPPDLLPTAAPSTTLRKDERHGIRTSFTRKCRNSRAETPQKCYPRFMEATFVNGRVVGGSSLHPEEKLEGCSLHRWRTVDCEGFAGPGRDIVECGSCGRQENVACNFDDDFA